MKILSQGRKGTKFLLENHEALLAFTKEGVRISTPKVLSKKDMESGDPVEIMVDWIEKNNPSVGTFFAIMDFLEEMNNGEELNTEKPKDSLFIPEEDIDSRN